MKKTIVQVIILFIMVLSTNLFALDFIVGAKGGYYIWEPFFKDIDAVGFSDINKGSGVMYGPVISILFTPDVSFSLAGLTGNQSTHWRSGNKYFGEGVERGKTSGTYFADINRTDIDSVLSLRISNNLKLFWGYKHQFISTNIQYTERRYYIYNPNGSMVIESDMTVTTPSHGPAFGIGFSFPLGKNYFISANLSALYMWGQFKIEENKHYDYNIEPEPSFQDPVSGEWEKEELDTKLYGVNFEPTIGLSVSDRGPIVTLGLRYQLLRTKIVDKFESAPNDWMNDTLYGLFVGVLFIF